MHAKREIENHRSRLFYQNRSTPNRHLDDHRFATSTTTRIRSHGHRTYRTVGARLPEAASHLLELQDKGKVPESWQGWTKMVQGRWPGIQDTKDCH